MILLHQLKRVLGLGPKRLVIFVLPELDEADITELDTLSQQYPNHTLIALDYDNDWPDHVRARKPLMPMEVLGDDATDNLYLDISRWQADTITAFWKLDPVLAPQNWVTYVYPHIVIRLRALRIIQQTARQGLFPAMYVVIGESKRFSWYDKVIHRALSVTTGAFPLDRAEAKRCRQIEPAPLPGHLLEAFAPPPMPEDDIAAHAKWQQRNEKTQTELLQRFEAFSKGRPMAMVFRRGRAGVNWAYDPLSGHMILDDNYSDFVQIRLAAQCQERQWCLCIVYIDRKPTSKNPGLDVLYPDHVLEVEQSEISPFLKKAGRYRQYEILKAFKRLVAGDVFKKAFTFQGVYLGDILPEPYFKNAINRTTSLLLSDGWLNFFQSVRIHAIFSGRIETIVPVVMAATKSSIVSATTKFGIGEEMLFPYSGSGFFDDEPATLPSHTILWGSPQVELLNSRVPTYRGEAVALGRTRNDAFVLGVPRIDKDKVKSRLGIPAANKLIVFGASFRTRFGQDERQLPGTSFLSQNTVEKCFQALNEICERVGNVTVLIKPHLSDDFETLKALTEEHLGENGLFAIEDENLHNIELLAITDVFVCNLSSMFSEAVISNVPCVQLWNDELAFFFERRRSEDYASMSKLVTSIDGLTKETERLLTDSDYREKELARARQGVEKYFGPMDGRNAERAAAAILDYAEETPSQP